MVLVGPIPKLPLEPIPAYRGDAKDIQMAFPTWTDDAFAKIMQLGRQNAALPQAGSGGLLGTPGSGGVMLPSFEFGNSGQGATAQMPTVGGEEVTPQQLVFQRAMKEAQERQNRLNVQKWMQATAPRPGREAINQNFYKGVGLDTDIFNSASGPYGQLQQAAVLTAQPRADRAIAALTSQAQERMNTRDNETKAQIARLIAGALSGAPGQTELGQNASDFQRFSPLYDPRLRRPRPQGVFAGA